MDLILDVAKIIASYDEDVWYKMTIADEEFAEYTRSDAGIQEFIRLFWKCKIETLGFEEVCNTWKIFGLLHSFNDEPAIIYDTGRKEWYKQGALHRDDDKPAIVNSDGSQYWYKNGKYHRDNDKPAITYCFGETRWFKDGQLHRDDNKPAIISCNASRYFRHGIEYTI